MQVTEDGVQRLFKLSGLFSFFIVLFPLTLGAQSFEDFKRTQTGSFETFKDAKDKEFNTYLKQQWQEYEAFASPKLFEKPKPKNIDAKAQKEVQSIGPKIDILQKKVPKVEETQKQVPLQNPAKDVMFDFFGTQVGFNIDKKMKDDRFYPKNQNGILSFFSVLAASDYESVLHDIENLSKELVLNDWGVNLLVKQLSQHIYTKPDEERLFRWFILNKLGYDTKVGLIEQHIVLLQPTKQVVFDTPRYKIGDAYYYAIDYQNNGQIGRLYTYEKNYPDAVKKLDFALVKTPEFVKNLIDKKLSFKDLKGEYTFEVHLNQNLVKFMKSYPQVDYEVYFNAAFDQEVYLELSEELRKYLNGQKASYGLNFLLHFVQKSFEYQRDNEQFGKDKVMFAEETLYYDRSDCEDRAILFSKLVKKVFNYSVVGVKYADHMSTALHVPLSGDSVKVGRSEYVVADPTYINANIGESMPKYRNIQPKSFIRLQ